MFGTLNGLMNHLSTIYQQIYQAKQKNIISIHKDYVKVYPLTIDTTLLNYNSFFPERAGNKSLNSIFIDQDNLNGTRNLIQQNVQAPSSFINEEIVETITTKEAQKRISPIQPNFTTPKPKNPCYNKQSYNPR